MIKKLLVLVCAIIISCSSFAQTFTVLEGESAARLSGISRNGKWAFDSESKRASFYDIAADKRTYFANAYISDISNDGVAVGKMKVGAKLENDTAAIYVLEKNEWIFLPLPTDPDVAGASSVRGISADGNTLVGYVYTKNNGRKPCLWTKTEEGYSAELLPCMEKDFTGRTPQGVDALFCSASGDIIGGRLVDRSGFFSMMTYWKKGKNNQWEFQVVGKDVVFKEGSVIPNVPEIPRVPNPKSYYSAADSAAYDQAVLDFNAGLITENPASYPQNYISNPDSIAAYNQEVKNYNDIRTLYNQQMALLLPMATGKAIDIACNYMSGNGRYLTATCRDYDEPTDKNITYPMYFDLELGETREFRGVSWDCIVLGVTDNGDLIYATPNRSAARTSFIIPAGTEKSIDMAEWVLRGTDEKLNIRPDLSFTFDSFDPITGAPISAVDSLIVGSIAASSDARIFLGSFYDVVSRSQFTYIVDMDSASDIDNIGMSSEVGVYPNPATDILYLKGNVEHVSVIDLTGYTVYESSSVSSSIPVGSFGKGTYLVKLFADKRITICKVVITN